MTGPGAAANIGGVIRRYHRVLILAVGLALVGACADEPTTEGETTTTTDTAVASTTSLVTTSSGPGVPALTIEVLYLPGSTPPDVFRVMIHNAGGEAIDVTGWALHTRGLPGVVFEWGTIVPGNGSLDILQVVAAARRCPSASATTVVYCYDRVRGIEPVLVAGAIVLEDTTGATMAEWEPPPGS